MRADPSRPAARCRARQLLRALALAWPLAAAADDALVERLEQRLASHGADALNAELRGNGGVALDELKRRAAACEFAAVSLAVRLGRTRDARALRTHTEALREANGHCTRYVLALLRPDEITRYCGSLPHWSPAQTARELRRRMSDIDADAVLRGTASGRACKAAYLHELQTTRVVVRRAALGAPGATDASNPTPWRS